MLTSIKLETYNVVVLKLCDSEPLQVQALSPSYSVWSRHNNICFELRDSREHVGG